MMQKISGAEQKKHSKVADIPHLSRFRRVGSELSMSRIVELNIFFRSLDWEADQNLLNLVNENFVTLTKKKPWKVVYMLSFSFREQINEIPLKLLLLILIVIIIIIIMTTTTEK